MKRADNIWEKVVDMDNLLKATQEAERRRRSIKSVIRFEEERELNLALLQDDLVHGSYRTSEYRFFDRQEGPKLRHLAALPFYPDRIAQWAVMLQTQTIFQRTFIDQTYAAIPGRGHHAAHDKLREYLRDPRAKYCLKIDFHHFFESIDKDILMEKVRRLFKDEQVLAFFKEVIYSYPRSGVPLGNLTSQWLANLYLSDFDHHFKEQMHCIFYLRYMDDIVVLGWSKPFLRRVLKRMRMLAEDLKLEINSNWQIFPIESRGVDFAGYRSWPQYCLLRTRIKHNLKVRLGKVETKLLRDASLVPTPSDVGVWASYKGILDHCDSYRLAQGTVNRVGRLLEARA
jgi:hypothetical protein